MLSPLSISDLPAIKFDGEWRVLGCLPETKESKSRFPKFGASFQNAAALDPSTWFDVDYSWLTTPILNQGSTSSCVAHGATTSAERCYVQSGRELVEFNQFFIYALINGGRDAGAIISDSLTVLMKYGVCEKNTLPVRLMYKNSLTQASYDNASKYKVANAFHCQSYDEICSAIALGFTGALGIYVGGNFSSVDSEGVAPLPRGGGGGHCMHFCGLKKSSRYGWLVKIQNSWGNWGMTGFAYLRREHFDNDPDAFAVQMVNVDETKNDNSEVPVVKV